MPVSHFTQTLAWILAALSVCANVLAEGARGNTGGNSMIPRMLWADSMRDGRPFSKDPAVIEFGGRYLLYYSMPPSTNKAVPAGWAIGVAESRDLVHWMKRGELLPTQECDRRGLCAPEAIVIAGQVHLFYQTYGNGKQDAICHAVSSDGLQFTRDTSNPVFRPTGEWNCGRAIDAEVFAVGDQLLLYFATRDPKMKIQMLGVAGADLKSDFRRSTWRQLSDGPILKPELPWETRCIEAPTLTCRGDTLFMFYAGGYNNDPQQIGCATSKEGLHWTRLYTEPLIPNGPLGDWNSSETGHPGVFESSDGRTYLFVQGNRDKGRTWFLSCYEIGWREERPFVVWDSTKFPMKRLVTGP
jgi:predicted GH43/DUF377 family glycosyl hydrolase